MTPKDRLTDDEAFTLVDEYCKKKFGKAPDAKYYKERYISKVNEYEWKVVFVVNPVKSSSYTIDTTKKAVLRYDVGD
jgi:hypothetical protein